MFSTITKNKQTATSLWRELRLMRSLFISVAGTDTEGRYNPNFVKELLAAANEPATKKFSIQLLRAGHRRDIYL